MVSDWPLVVLRGGGDLATGVAYRLVSEGLIPIVLELPQPLVVRRLVSLASAVAEGEVVVEGLLARRVVSVAEALAQRRERVIPVLVSATLPAFPGGIDILVDARMAKRNPDTRPNQARLVIALGPGYTAGVDCHAVIETMRGHTLGRVIWEGPALPNTGTPGLVAGKGAERVLRAPAAGAVAWEVAIGQAVERGQPLGHVAGQPLLAPFAGVIRGLIAPGTRVPAGLKIGDVDARADASAAFTISDKALAIGAGVLEAIWRWRDEERTERRHSVRPHPPSSPLPHPLATLPAALGLADRELIALVGAGGKTSLMFALAAALPGGVICTSTTRLARDELALAPAVARILAPADLAPADLAPADLPPALRRYGKCLVVGRDLQGADDIAKVEGVPLALPGTLWRRPDVAHVLVEADGSRRLPVKAPGDGEPVIPPESTLVVPVVGLSALGRPIRDVAHRPERLAALTGLAPDAPLTTEALAALLTHPEGGLKNIPEGARVVPFLNDADTPARLAAARHVARLALREPRLERLVAGYTRDSVRPVREIFRRARGVVLAAGESRRMGRTKQLLPWGETTVLGRTLEHLAGSALFDGVVVTGHEAEAVAAEATRYGVPSLFNPDYAAGEMVSSLQAAIRALPATIDAVLVILADQPEVGATLIDALLVAYGRGYGRLIAPAYQGRRGNPVLIDRAFFAELLTLPPDAAPRDLVAAHDDELHLVPVENDVVVRDLDTPDDYAAQRPR